MSAFIIDEYDTQITRLVSRDIKQVADVVESLRIEGLSNFRISEWEEVDGEDVHVMTMNLDEFDSIAYLGSII